MKRSLLRIASIPLRAWRSRGFGIHSPYAYRIVTTVLRSRWRWYGYSDVPRSQRRLFRVLAELAPGAIVRSGPLTSAQHRAADRALQAAAPAPACPKAVIVSPGAIVGFTYLRKVIASGGAVIFTNAGERRSAGLLREVAPGNVAIEGYRLAVVTAPAGVPPQHIRTL